GSEVRRRNAACRSGPRTPDGSRDFASSRQIAGPTRVAFAIRHSDHRHRTRAASAPEPRTDRNIAIGRSVAGSGHGGTGDENGVLAFDAKNGKWQMADGKFRFQPWCWNEVLIVVPDFKSDLNRAFNIRPQEIANPFGISSDRPVSSRHIMFDTIKAEIS